MLDEICQVEMLTYPGRTQAPVCERHRTHCTVRLKAARCDRPIEAVWAAALVELRVSDLGADPVCRRL